MGTKFSLVGRGGVCIRKRERPLREPCVWALILFGAVSALLAVNAGSANAAPTADADRSVQSVPGTSGLSSVACTSKSSCVAVGSVGGEGVVVPIDNGVPGPAQALSDTDTLSSVTCTKAGRCIAAGLGETQIPGGPNSTAGAVVEIRNGQASLSGLFLGTGNVFDPDSVNGVSIACSDTARCMAVGNSFFEGGIGDNVLKGQISPVGRIGPVQMSGVECWTEGRCVADGQVPSASRRVPAFGFAQFVQIGGANGDISLGPTVDFGANSDPSAGTCRGSLEFCQMAGVVGDEGAVFSVVGESSGLTRPVAGTSSLNDLACAGSYWCLAVGQTTAGEGAVVPVGWEDPSTMQAVTGVDEFSGVSCPTQGFCIAVGTTGPVNNTTGAIDIFRMWG